MWKERDDSADLRAAVGLDSSLGREERGGGGGFGVEMTLGVAGRLVDRGSGAVYDSSSARRSCSDCEEEALATFVVDEGLVGVDLVLLPVAAMLSSSPILLMSLESSSSSSAGTGTVGLRFDAIV